MGEHASTNMAIIEGALGKDPEFKEVDGRKIAKLLVATQEMWRERGELHSRTDWHTVHVSNARQVEAIEKSVRRGSRIRIEGLMKTLAHQSAEGQEWVRSTVISLERGRGRLRLLDAPIEKAGGRKDEAR